MSRRISTRPNCVDASTYLVLAVANLTFFLSFLLSCSFRYPQNRHDNHQFAGRTLRFLKRPVICIFRPVLFCATLSLSTFASILQLRVTSRLPSRLSHRVRPLCSHFDCSLIRREPLGRSTHSRYSRLQDRCSLRSGASLTS